MTKPEHVILYMKPICLLEALVNICLKPVEGKLTLLSILVTVSQSKLTVPTGPAAATPFLPAPGAALAHS